MKIFCMVRMVPLFLAMACPNLYAQTTGSSSQARVAEMGANYTLWQYSTAERGHDGKMVTKVHQYRELASGLNYLNSAGQWTASQEKIEAFAGGAVARQGQHKVIFANNLNTAGAIDMQVDNLRLRSHILGLIYTDSSTGKAVLIAQLQDSEGELVGDNQVLYRNAFNGVKADVRYTYRRGGLEQDVILREQPPVPEVCGMNPKTTELEAFTEFVNPPTANIVEKKKKTPNTLADQTIRWGKTSLGNGKAFSLDGESVPTPVAKRFVQVGGRHFLLEKVRMADIKPALSKLPEQASNTKRLPGMASTGFTFPRAPLAKSAAKPMRLAMGSLPDKGYVLDYVTISSAVSGYTFQSGSTYYISGAFNIFGSGVFEGGAVIKLAPGAGLIVDEFASHTFKSGPYLPVMFTARDDNRVGEFIAGSTGNPSGYYGTPLSLDGASGYGDIDQFSNLRICYAEIGISDDWYMTLTNVQFVNCAVGIRNIFYESDLNNVLFANVRTNFSGGALVAWQTTFANATSLAAPGANVTLTNCLLANVTNGVANASGANNGFYNCPEFGANAITNTTYPFQTVGGGSFYLATNSVFHNAGTTNVDPAVLADLAQRTTYPPVVYFAPGRVFTNSLDLYPRAQRDANGSPDLGYHYAALDYLIGSVAITNAAIVVNPGTAIGFFSTNNAFYGLDVGAMASLTFNGLANNWVHVAEYDIVQEGSANGWWPSGVNQSNGGSHDCVINGQFVDWSSWMWNMIFIGTFGSGNNDGPFNFRNCQFHVGEIATYDPTINFSNCLFERVYFDYENGGFGDTNTPVFRNNLVYGGVFQYGPWFATNAVIRDNLFDHATIPDWISFMGYDGGYNAYVTNCDRLNPVYPTDIILSDSPAYQTGTMGYFYLPPNSPLINAGSTTADKVGLYHFTTQTNQVKETNSVVDIGYHYVATDGNGVPDDSNGDGFSDFLEDANGNGLVDNGETPWMAPPVIVTQPASEVVLPGSAANFSVVASSVVPVGYQWYFNGTNLLAGATSSTLVLTNVQPTEAGNYSVVVTNPAGSAISSNALLTVLGMPVIITQPTNQVVVLGNRVSLSVTVSGDGPFTYQWLYNGTNLPPIITTVAGNGTAGYAGDQGVATSAKLNSPSGVTVDVYGDLFVADKANHVIREVATNGLITTFAGNGSAGFAGDGNAATNANLNSPSGVAVDAYGNLFIADSGNNVIREVATNGIITTVAGNGSGGYAGDGSAATSANLSNPTGVVVDATGNLFIADSGNNVIREVTTNGIITTVAGNGSGGYSGDGDIAVNANLSNPTGVALDATGNLFIADSGNTVIREVTTNGIITTVAGNGSSGYAGDGSAATSANLSNPAGLAVDTYGDLFIADSGNHVIREVATNGIITTVAGNGSAGYVGDGSAATNASLNSPSGVAVDATGNVFLADTANNVIRAVSATTYTGPSTGTLTLFNIATLNSGNYSVLVCNQYGCVTTTGAVLTVLVPPAIISQPLGCLTSLGSNVTFSVTATGSMPLGYQWYFNGTNVLADATNSSFNVDNVQTNHVGFYSVTVSNAAGVITSLQAVLAIRLPAVHTFAAGGERLMRLTTNGYVVSWGGNQHGELGDYTHLDSQNPVCAVGLTNMAFVASGLNHSLAMDSNGVLWAWGDNANGQLGNGTRISTNAPVQVVGFTNPVVAVAGNGGYNASSIAATADGLVWNWGAIDFDPCNGFAISPTPRQVTGLTNVIAVAKGTGNFMALTADGTVWEWGVGDYGVFGNGFMWSDSYVPIQVTGLSNIVAICAGDTHCLALDSHCQVWAWGLNNGGQLGDNAAESMSALPVLVFSHAVAIAAGSRHSLALDQYGQLWAWGSDSAGQLGDAGSASLYVPTLIVATNLVAIAAGSDASLALDGDGNLWQWGSSDSDAAVVSASAILSGGNSKLATVSNGAWNWNGSDGYPQLAPSYYDYYQGQLPSLRFNGGNAQVVAVDQEFPLVLQVTKDDGTPLVNAPVSLEVIALSPYLGSVSLLTNSGGNLYSGLRATTDANGNISILGYLHAPLGNYVGCIRVLAASHERVTESDFIAVPDSLGLQNFGGTNVDLNADPDGDGVSTWQELLAGTDPTDYYNGNLPNLQIVSGSPQTNIIGRYSRQPLVVQVTDANNHALTNAPIVFSAQISGTVLFSAATNGALTNMLSMRSDTDGMVSGWMYLPISTVGENHVVVSAWSRQNSLQVFAVVEAQLNLPTVDLVLTNDGIDCLVAMHSPGDAIVSAVNQVMYQSGEYFYISDGLADALYAESAVLLKSFTLGINVVKLPPPVVTPASGFINNAASVSLSLGSENLTNLVAGLYQTELARNGSPDELLTVTAYAQSLRDQGINDEDIRTNLINGTYFRNSGEYTNTFGAPGDVYLENTNYTIQYSLDGGSSWTNYTGPLSVSSSVKLLARVAKAGSADGRTKYAYLTSDPATVQFQYLPASWLIQYFGADYQNNSDAAPTADPDHDGLNNWQEYLAGTNPTNSDTDGDGLSDGMEVATGSNPLNPGDYPSVRLGYWRFNTTNWFGEQGQVPLASTSLISAPDWSDYALVLDTNLPAYLAYRVVETNGNANILCQNGSLRFWFNPDWSSGTGPGSLARLIEIGSQDSTDGWWALVLSPDGTTLSFVTQTNGVAVTNLSATVNWSRNGWHQVVLAYSATNSTLYLDGQPVANGAGVACLPDAAALTGGFRIGSDASGHSQALGQFDELETFDYPLAADPVLANYNLLMNGGTGPVDFIESIEGRNPAVHGAVSPDINGLVNLQIYTPLWWCKSNN